MAKKASTSRTATARRGASPKSSSPRTARRSSDAETAPPVDLFAQVEERVQRRTAEMIAAEAGEEKGSCCRGGACSTGKAAEDGTGSATLSPDELFCLYQSEGSAVEIEYLRAANPLDQRALDLLRAEVRRKCAELRLQETPAASIHFGVFQMGAQPKADMDEVEAEVKRLESLDWETIKAEVRKLQETKGGTFTLAVKLALAPTLAGRGINFGAQWLEDAGRDLTVRIGGLVDRVTTIFSGGGGKNPSSRKPTGDTSEDPESKS